MSQQFKPSDFSDFSEVLHHHAISQGKSRFFTFLDKSGEQISNHSFAEMDAAARGVAQNLLQFTQPGHRVLLLQEPGADFVAGLFGAWYAGLVPVPVLPPGGAGAKRAVPRLRVIVRDAGCEVILTKGRIRDVIRDLDSDWASQGTWVCSEEFEPCSSTGRLVPYAGHSCLLQYTSGSTGEPKGVELTHQNMLENSASIQGAFGHDQSSQTVFWLPPQHDMGLVGGILQPAYVGFPTVHMSPMTFLQRPLRWLQAISRYRATTAGGPDFAFRMCAQKVTEAEKKDLDLRTWTVAFSGSETVRPDTLEMFAQAFRECGFSKKSYLPCYGLAEATLMVTGKRAESDSGPRLVHADRKELGLGRLVEAPRGEETTVSLTSCGPKMPGQDVVVVEPGTLTEVPDGVVGEVLCSGANVARGYFGREDATRRTFGLRIPRRKESFMNTGDLGFLQNGELFLAGRSKDLIIVRGQNHYPGDLEATTEHAMAEESIAIGSVCAFSEEFDGEKITLCIELRGTRERAQTLSEEIGAVCRDAMAAHHGVRPFRVALVRPGSLLKTTSGKLQRAACRRALASGEIEVVAECTFQESDYDESESAPAPASAAEIQDWLVRYAARKKGVSETAIDPTASFASFGLDSLEAVSLASDLAAWTGQQVPATALWEHPNIIALAEFLRPERKHETPGAPLTGPRESRGIAIVGMACRTPGASSLGEFWELLSGARTAIDWADSDRPGASDLNSLELQGGYISGIERFDARLFGISPDEARLMDPQHRLLLRSTWEALESGGYRPSMLSGSKTGVYVGISNADYSRRLSGKAGGPLVGTGNALSLSANRISYQFNFSGPSVAVDTACSSSLVAVHLACVALETGECSSAIAAGVNLLIDPEVTSLFASAGMLSKSSRCHTFRETADGYVRGEGCGVVLLKRLEDAERDGDRIYAVIRGTAVNQDGRSNGVTAPNLVAQRLCIESALEKAGVDGSSVDYVETHGTGTPLGDPIEVQALATALARDHGGAVQLGAVKANVGHLESAAGIIGLIKTSLVLWHQSVPPQPGAGPLNPRLNLPAYLCVAESETKNAPRVASVSSFGFGGTNAHAVLVPGSRSQPVRDDALGEHPLVVMLSAHCRRSLMELAKKYREAIAAGGWPVAKAISHVTLTRRERLRFVEYVVAADVNELLVRLESVGGKSCDETARDMHELKWDCGSLDDPARWILSWSTCFPLVQCAFDEIRGQLSELGAQGDVVAAHLALLSAFESVGCTAPFVSGTGLGALAAALFSAGLRGEDARRVASYCLGLGGPRPSDLYARPGHSYLSYGKRFEKIDLDSLKSDMGVASAMGISLRCAFTSDIQHACEVGSELDTLELLVVAARHLSNVDWSSFFEGWVGQTRAMSLVEVPNYAFDEQPYWFEDLPSRSAEPISLALSWVPREPQSDSDARGKKWLLVGADPERLCSLRDALSAQGIAAKSSALSDWVRVLKDNSEVHGVLFLSAERGSKPSEVSSAIELALAWGDRTDLPGGVRILTQGVFEGSSANWSTGGGLWGAIRSFKNEHPFSNIQLVDCDESPETQLQELIRVLSEAPEEDVRVSRNGLLSPRLESHRSYSSPRQIHWDQGAVVISGGLGVMGLALAEKIAGLGCRHLVLIGRDRSRGSEEVERLRQRGVHVAVRSVDVSAAEQVEEALTVTAKEFGLCGVIHAAGNVRDGLWENHTKDTFEAVWAPKVIGAENLWRAARAHQPQFFCCVSSLAAILGSPGQGPYAAANAQMDLLVRNFRAHESPASSIALGPVDGTAMWDHAARKGGSSHVALLSLEQATEAILDAIRGHEAWRAATGAPLDTSQFLDSLARSTQRLVQDWIGEKEPNKSTALLLELSRNTARREARLAEWIRERVAEARHVEPTSIPSNQGFLELGLDSLTVLQLRNRLQQELRVSVPSTALFEYPTIERLAPHLVSLTFGGDETGAASTPGTDVAREAGVDEFWNEIERLEEQEALRLIGEER